MIYSKQLQLCNGLSLNVQMTILKVSASDNSCFEIVLFLKSRNFGQIILNLYRQMEDDFRRLDFKKAKIVLSKMSKSEEFMFNLIRNLHDCQNLKN